MDRTTEMLASYACRLSYEDLGPKTVHQVKRTLVDTLGCAMGGFVSEPAGVRRQHFGGPAHGLAPFGVGWLFKH